MADHRLKIRKLDAVDLVKGIFKLYLTCPGYYIKLILIFLAVIIFIEYFLLNYVHSNLFITVSPETGAPIFDHKLIGGLSVFVIAIIAMAVMVPINLASIIALTRSLIIQREFTLPSILHEIHPKVSGCVLVYLTYQAVNLILFCLIWLLLAGSIFTHRLELLFSLAVVVFGIFVYFIPKFLFIVHSFYFEESSVKEAIKDSFRLTNGYWFHTIWYWTIVNFLVMIGEIIGYVGTFLITLLFAADIAALDPVVYAIPVAMSSLWMTFILVMIFPIRIIGSILMYFDLRARKDGFTNEDLERSLNPPETTIPAELTT